MVPLLKRPEKFRFTDNPKIPQATLAEGTWIADRESIIHHARRLGERLQEAEGKRELSRVVGEYTRTELLVLDEFGYLALPEGATELIFRCSSSATSESA